MSFFSKADDLIAFTPMSFKGILELVQRGREKGTFPGKIWEKVLGRVFRKQGFMTHTKPESMTLLHYLQKAL